MKIEMPRPDNKPVKGDIVFHIHRPSEKALVIELEDDYVILQFISPDLKEGLSEFPIRYFITDEN